jgi:LPXTG-site transpeptidase (sortase) family protein
MRYSLYKRNRYLVKKLKAISVLALGAIPALVGAYILTTSLAPKFYVPRLPAQPNAYRNDVTEARVIIPKIGVSTTYASGDKKILDRHAWWRFPERGNPRDGGNFIVSGHRFRLSKTPGDTVKKSTFYNIDRLIPGDLILVTYENKIYEYVVEDKFSVRPEDTHIEKATHDNRLTLYSCTLAGSWDGRIVIVAEQVAS